MPPTATIPGTLSRRGPDSFLDPNDWLLMDGFDDDRQAADAATELVNLRHLEDGDPVEVTGSRGVVGTQPVVVMTDIQPAVFAEAVMAADASGGRAPRKRRAKPKAGRSRVGAGKTGTDKRKGK